MEETASSGIIVHQQIENPFVVLEFFQFRVERFNDRVNKIIQHLQSESGRDHAADKILRLLINQFILPGLLAFTVCFIRRRLDLTDNYRQIDAVGVDIIIADDILNAFGDEPENIDDIDPRKTV